MIKTKFTKIVATVSDRRCDVDFIKDLFDNGLNVVRMNSAHIQREGFERIIGNVRQVSDRIGILMDTKGPEIRTTTNVGDENIAFVAGREVEVTGTPDQPTSINRICLSYPHIAKDVKVGMHFLIDDGELDFKIEEIREDGVIRCVAQNDGELGSRKSVNIPGASIKLPSLTERDKTNIGYAMEMKVDFIAHSFVRSRQDVLDIQNILDAHNSPIKIISKIENQEGIDNFDEILDASYGIMIARGDLGIEVPEEEIPIIQKELIQKCIKKHKPVIVATQMLHTMITNPRPTRAEVSDIANAVMQGTDALMLSGETAYGKYPIDAIATMTRIISATERSANKHRSAEPQMAHRSSDVTEFLTHNAVDSQYTVGTRAIVTDSYTGRTARYIASFRGISPTLALCYHKNVTRLLALSYGVYSIYQEKNSTSREYLYNGLKHLIDMKLITPKDTIAYVGGGFGEGKGTTFLEINRVADVMENYDSYNLPNLEEKES